MFSLKTALKVTNKLNKHIKNYNTRAVFEYAIKILY